MRSVLNNDNKQELVLVDRVGRVQVVSVTDKDMDGATSETSFSSESRVSSGYGDEDDNGVLAVDLSRDGRVLAVVERGGRCILRSVVDGSVLGEVLLPWASEIVGVGFVESDDEDKKIFVWSRNGGAVVYEVLGSSGDSMEFKASFEVPVLPGGVAERESVVFRQFSGSLLRIHSVCVEIGGSHIWKPYITVWSMVQLELIEVEDSSRLFSFAKLIGEGGFPGDLVETVGRTTESLQDGNSFGNDGKIVSSSMVLSDEIFAPYAVVYGFYSGQIEVLEFSSFSPRENSEMDIVNHQIYPQFSERFFSGHTGAILCLAAHRIVAQSESHSFSRALISGSTDCTVRIWDLDTGTPILVMHHHVAPVQQIILPPPGTFNPWNNCFISVSEDCGVVLVSLDSLRVERMFPGHPSYPSMVAWDGVRGYIACLCRNLHSSSAATSVLYLWDVKTGARERVITGTASHTMFGNFCYGIKKNSIGGILLGGNVSASALLLPVFKDVKSRGKTEKKADIISKGGKGHKSLSSSHASLGTQPILGINDHDLAGNSSTRHSSLQKINAKKKAPIKCFCPFPGIASLKFDLSSLMSPPFMQKNDKQMSTNPSGHETNESSFQHRSSIDSQGTESHLVKESLEGYLLRFSLCFLHQWDVDSELDKLLMEEMNVFKPKACHVASGILGDRGTVTLNFPGLQTNIELWKSSSEFCAMRSLAIVSLAQRMITVTHTCSRASSALAAFYTRNFAERFPQIKPPSLQLLVSFWQDPSEHIRMAARSLFHCAAPRAIPHALRGVKVTTPGASSGPSVFEENACYSHGSNSELNLHLEGFNVDELETSSIVTWLESFEFQEWVLWIGGTSQDAMASNIIVAAALVVWYPSLVKTALAELVVNQLVKLVMSMNERYSSTAAELLAEGMVSTWSICLGPELPQLIGDVLFQTECLSGTPMNKGMQNTAAAITIREALVEILLPSLAMADIVGFLNVIQGQIWATSSDSPVHLVSLKTLIRVVRGSPKSLAPYLAKAIHYVLQTMDPGNLVMRKACLNSSMIVLKEIARVFPMVALNETSTRLAVGDAIGDIHSATIQIFDIESVTKVKILDASAPPGLPSFLEETMKSKITTITALTFSPDGEGLIAFSTNGLMIRWWSLGTGWWEKFSRNLVPVPCTKLIFVPPWEGFSPNSSRSSIMAGIVGHGEQVKLQDKTVELDDTSMMNILIQNIDLSYRLQWVDGRKVTLIHHGQEVGTFQL